MVNKTAMILGAVVTVVALAALLRPGSDPAPGPSTEAPELPAEGAEGEAPTPIVLETGAVLPTELSRFYDEDPPEDATPLPEVVWDQLPVAHRPEAMEAGFQRFQGGLQAAFPHVEFDFQPIDCAGPPCRMGLTFDPGDFSDPDDARSFFAGLPAAAEQAYGFPMAVIDAEDVTGGEAVWMYSMPGVGAPMDALGTALQRDARRRHDAWMEPFRPEPEPLIPEPTEE